MPMLKNFKLLKKTTAQIGENLRERTLDGRKVCFIRPRPYLEVGDTFEQFGTEFKITKLEEGKLEEVCQRVWAEAGYDSYDDLKEAWIAAHKQYNPAQTVWLHYFERIE